jgi:GAF domain-containing protein
MSATPDSTIADPEHLISDLQRQLAEREAGLAECKAELDQALQRESATAEVFQVINSSPGNLAPVFDAILDKAHTLCGAEFGSLFFYDGEHFRAIASHGVPEALASGLREGIGNDSRARQQLIAGEPFAHIHDSALEEGAVYRGMDMVSSHRTLLSVPLRKGDALLGQIVAGRLEVRPFTDKQIALLQNFAAQAVIAMENARLITETREALDQQTATAEVLQVINSSPGDLAPVFDAMLEKATRLCEAAFGGLAIFSGDTYRVVAMHNVPQPLAAVWQGPLPIRPETSFGRIARGESPVHIADISEDETYRVGSPLRRAAVELGGARTALWVALRKDGALLGTFVAWRQEVRPFTDKQIALLENFAAQAVIAMENARLLTETREALEQQTATSEVLQVINSSPGDLAPVFDAILEKAHTLCEAAHGVLVVRDGEEFRPVAIHGDPHFVEGWRQVGSMRAPEGGVAARLIRGERVVHIVDAMDYDSYPVPSMRGLIEAGGIRTMVTVPLGKDDELLGIIGAYRQEVRPFTDKQIALLQNFAAQAVIAIENARLLTETREALEQQTATAEVLGVINSSPGDLRPVFDAILEKAHSLCGGASGGLVVIEGDRARAVAVHGEPKFAEYWMQQGWFRSPNDPENFARLQRGEPIHTPDATSEEVRSRSTELHNRLVELSGARSMLVVPLRKDHALLGIITAFRQEVRPFSDKEIALLQNFAAQAVIAMENARLITETREALEQQTATAEVLQVINASPGDLQPVFNTILKKVVLLCGAAHAILRTLDSNLLQLAAAYSEPEVAERLGQLGPINLDRVPPDHHLGRILRGERVVHVSDVQQTDTYREIPTARERMKTTGMRTCLAVALHQEKALLGVITAYRKEVRPFTQKEISLLENFAAQAEIAMENARLLSELHQRTDEVAELNRGLEARVAEQVEELGRVGRLKRFLAPQLAELIVSHGDEKILESHRRDIVVVFCDLRGYTAFTETAEPEEVLDFLREYHGALGPLVSQFEGTLDQFSGDGIMVFFNDPVPIPDPAARAVNMAVAMREAAGTLIADWRERGRDLGFGAGIAQGYATLGQIGFSERSGYTAIGTVCNVAARLCAEAKDGQILLSQRVNVALRGSVSTEQLGALALKGLTQPVVAYNVPLVGSQATFHVIQGGAPSA